MLETILCLISLLNQSNFCTDPNVLWTIFLKIEQEQHLDQALLKMLDLSDVKKQLGRKSMQSAWKLDAGVHFFC